MPYRGDSFLDCWEKRQVNVMAIYYGNIAIYFTKFTIHAFICSYHFKFQLKVQIIWEDSIMLTFLFVDFNLLPVCLCRRLL